ncbi:MAG: M23 family metallopeptidase, partial [Planctomycetes bacterium]|nr:M23 family metallopeptidase [Planctomycetota bacterium]
ERINRRNAQERAAREAARRRREAESRREVERHSRRIETERSRRPSVRSRSTRSSGATLSALRSHTAPSLRAARSGSPSRTTPRPRTTSITRTPSSSRTARSTPTSRTTRSTRPTRSPTSTPISPPYTATPLGQRLTPNACNAAKTTRTPNSPRGGYAGYTRSQGTKLHGGIDDPSRDLLRRDTARYYGTRPGVVTRSGNAYDSRGTYLGKRVEITTIDRNGIWTSKTLHHGKTLVRQGQEVRPGQPIAQGSGHGDQFRSPDAGGPHVHWDVRRNGKPVDPLTGSQLPRRKGRGATSAR